MKYKKFLLLIASLLCLFSTFSTAFAQDYYFEIPETDIQVYVESDGTVTIEYYYLFRNTPGAHVIDYVDIGMPGASRYSLSDITATIDGSPVTDISSSDYVDGVALGLGSKSIQPGDSGIVFMRAENIRENIYSASSEEVEPYASMRFQPNYYDSQYVSGPTSLTITFHLPPGITDTNAPRYFSPKNWPGDENPASMIDDEGRVIYQWVSANASASGVYEFGVAFPAALIPAESIRTEQTVTFNPSALLGTVLPIACCGGIFAIFALVIYLSIKSSQKRRLQYLPPKIAIEGHGIKRGLTAVEAAILMERPMDKVLTMILFSVLKKEAATVASRDPLEIKVEEKLPEGLHGYEQDFLMSFLQKDAAKRRKQLQTMMVGLVKSVGEKMKGFSKKETVAYYEDIINRAWKQVEDAETPEVKAEKYSEGVEWTMMDREYDTRTRRTFGTGPVFMPGWWWRADPSIGRTTGRTVSGGAPSGPSGGKSTTITLPQLPGSNAAASVINTAQAFSAGVVGNVAAFTGAVSSVTNPAPKPTSSTFRSGGGGFSGGGGHSCACACACAGCACACAGGGR